MRRSTIIRFLVLLALWLPIAILALQYGIEESKRTRLDALVLSNGLISSIQQESWFSNARSLQVNDRILWIGGKTFDVEKTKEWFTNQDPDRLAKVIVERDGERFRALDQRVVADGETDRSGCYAGVENNRIQRRTEVVQPALGGRAVQR